MKFILAKKQYMTQIFTEDGVVHPATVLLAGPLTVTKVKTKDSDGYDAVQVGFETAKEKRVSRAVRGITKDLGFFKTLKEFRVEKPNQAVGDTINVSVFAAGDKVNVSAISKGKGFQGVVKRHGFAGGRRSHGQKHSEREPGSIGGGGRAGGRVVKGMRMAGRMGNDRITVKNLKVIDVMSEENILVIQGAIPGRKGTLVEVRG